MLADNTTCQQLVSGMSINAGKLVSQHFKYSLGGGNLGNGSGRFSDKVIKFQVEEVQTLCVIF
jgi:hypothetical protein